MIDGTGRGHALCDLFVRTDPNVTVYYGPGCDLIEDPRIVAVPSITLTDVGTVLAFLADHPVDFVFVSNIDALSAGYVDDIRAAGHRVIGPTAAAAALENSKARGKQFCVEHGLPVPGHAIFTDPDQAHAYIRNLPYRCVVKIDQLTPHGDGSVVCDSTQDAHAAVDRMVAEFGQSARLIIEERLTGPEISIFALIDGETAMLFPPAMDYKRALEGHRGKNCDGMGSIAPHPADSPRLREYIRAKLVEPLVHGLREEGLDFTGFVYLGAILTERGPVVIEINARFGDSEAQVVLPGVQSDLTQLCRAVLDRRLADEQLRTDGLTRCVVALVQGAVHPAATGEASGWPFGDFTVGHQVRGIATVDSREAQVFYANIRRDPAGTPVTCGGRVLHVVGTAGDLTEARARAYRQVRRVHFPGMRYRSDIGDDIDRAVVPDSAPAHAGTVLMWGSR